MNLVAEHGIPISLSGRFMPEVISLTGAVVADLIAMKTEVISLYRAVMADFITVY
jgi:hypothetical protein